MTAVADPAERHAAATGDGDALTQLRTSARGWHGVQLAVLGFIGLCGALQAGAEPTGPVWLQQVAGALVLLALAIACVATVLVAGAAWPVAVGGRGETSAAGVPVQVHRGARHLRTGIALTFVAVGMVALATSSAWWPASGAGPRLVEVSTGRGTFCGELVTAGGGTLALEVAGEQLGVPLGQIAQLRPVSSCD